MHGGKKPNHSKEIGLAEKAELSWKASPLMGEQVLSAELSCKRERPRVEVSREQCWSFPSMACMSLCSLGSRSMVGAGLRPGQGCALTLLQQGPVRQPLW